MTDSNGTKINDLHKADDNKSWEEHENVKPLGADSTSKPEFEKLYQELQAQYTELDDKYKRLWADQQNMMNRFNRERSEIQKYAATSTIEAILPALDNFDFAIRSIKENTSFDEIIKSISMLQEQLIMSLKSVGLEEIDTNSNYNPQLHEAISNRNDNDREEGAILEVLKKGYRIKDKVIRPAMVVVCSKG